MIRRQIYLCESMRAREAAHAVNVSTLMSKQKCHVAKMKHQRRAFKQQKKNAMKKLTLLQQELALRQSDVEDREKTALVKKKNMEFALSHHLEDQLLRMEELLADSVKTERQFERLDEEAYTPVCEVFLCTCTTLPHCSDQSLFMVVMLSLLRTRVLRPIMSTLEVQPARIYYQMHFHRFSLKCKPPLHTKRGGGITFGYLDIRTNWS